MNKMTISVFELYSGIGGMHFALLESGLDAEVVRAIDINTTANSVYRHNFPKHNLLEKNVQSLTEDDFNRLNVEMILMSPPCQPHTRNGLKLDDSDRRSESLSHIIKLIPLLKTVKYILLENVKGFEVSVMHDELLQQLDKSNFVYQEFLLTPSQFSIPNSRLRYYLLAKKKPLQFCFKKEDAILKELPKLENNVETFIQELNWKYKKLCTTDSCFCIGLILEKTNLKMIPDKVLQKYGSLFDIVTSDSVRSCCFTKGYGHFVEGTGSVLSSRSSDYVKTVFDSLEDCLKNSEAYLNMLQSLELRYFTPQEISSLMCFPKQFSFPECLSDRQMFRLLGNSINVHVVALLIKILVS